MLNFLKGTFTISGYLLNDNNSGIEGDVLFDGYQGNPVYIIKSDGYFIFTCSPVYIWDFFWSHFIMISVRTSANVFQGVGGYSFRMLPNKNIKVKFYPYSDRIIIGSKTKKLRKS